MRLTQRLEAVEKRAGSTEPGIVWMQTVFGTEPDDIERKAIASWGMNDWALFEAEDAETEEDFEARVHEAVAAPGASTAYARFKAPASGGE